MTSIITGKDVDFPNERPKTDNWNLEILRQ